MTHSDHPKSPSLLRNPVSFVGIVVAAMSTAFGLPLMFLDMVSRRTHPYLAVLIYLVLPFVATGGVGLIVFGALWERWRRRRRPELIVPPLPQIDLNQPAHQAAVVAAVTATMVIVILLSITGYRAYHFTESVKFCGLVCHQVMKPEYTAYQYSPHARVACTQCHVGPGADWFVRSKLSGLYQVYAVTTHRYPRPIETPVKSLRPAQETCEQCHWPAKFFGAQQKTFTHYLSDEANSPWQIQMLIKVGGGNPATGGASGIHWHMNIAKTIEYVAADKQREVIPWVRVTEPGGHVRVYQSTEVPLSPAQVTAATPRQMDCVDCHNRPSHIYTPPDRALDAALEQGRIDSSLPYVKREAVRLLAGTYRSEAQAMAAIRTGLTRFYETTYPDMWRQRQADIQRAAEETAKVFARTIFPEMKADWRVHPNHIGHRNTDGCFRCHDGQHASADGHVITKDCNACHTILAQGAPATLQGQPLREQPFQHPVDMGMDVTEQKCSLCHNGTTGL
ncbi:MAG: NapC/NirT family cytochrome c [Candidatus Omnitrophica bacterium]|nr:NapC/NirT family cytochrome c [Candidatus Omnitrophota bacterium]